MQGAAHQGFEAASSPLWLCGHFAAKPYALMLDRLSVGKHTSKDVLFWQTKSFIQPVAKGECVEGVYEERRVFEREAATQNARLQRWAAKGVAFSEKRMGSWPNDYRHLMTELPTQAPSGCSGLGRSQSSL
jgi:hypothetical protein